jgi:hypothetical protein
MDYRNERQNYHKNKRFKRSERAIKKIKKNSEIYGRALSLTLTDLMARIYLKLNSFSRNRKKSENKYQKRFTFLKNRISSGRNWHLMQ